MSKILSDLKNQLQQNIIAHQDIINMSDDIIEIVQIINKKLKKEGKYYFVEMEGQQQMLSI